MIWLSRNAHESWNCGKIALWPVSLSDDRRKLTLQFFAQPEDSVTTTQMSVATLPSSTRHITARSINYDVGDDIYRLKSGQLIEMTTNDVYERPLPSFGLLEMRWFLQRIAGMAGVIESTGPGFWCEDTDSLMLDDNYDVSEWGYDTSMYTHIVVFPTIHT